MQNRTDIINMALQRCGAAGVNIAFQDTSEAAIAAAAYERCRRLVLSRYIWSFALRCVIPAREAQAPASGYRYGYALPADCIQVADVHPYCAGAEGAGEGGSAPDSPPPGLFREPPAEWAVVGRSLYCNEGGVALRYVSSQETPMPEAFASALAWRLAFEISPYLQQGNQAQQFYQLYETALDEARVENDVQQNPQRPDGWKQSPHIRAQFGGQPERW